MTAPSYDPERHILLRDQAHKRRIHEEGEFGEYLRRVAAAAYRPDDPGARMTVFDVLVPDWPPAPRSPLQILFGGDDPFADKPWRGRQPAVDRDWWTERETSRIGRALVPNDRDFDPERMAYQWQVPIFDPRPHVLMRCWCNENGVDLVAFLRKGVPEVGLRLFETTNPHVREERGDGLLQSDPAVLRARRPAARVPCGGARRAAAGFGRRSQPRRYRRRHRPPRP